MLALLAAEPAAIASAAELQSALGGETFAKVEGNKTLRYYGVTKESTLHFSEKVLAPTFEVIEGNNQTPTVGTDREITFRVDGDFAKFKDLYLNGKLVDSSNYTAKAGSVIITLKADYVKTLPVGKQVFTVAFTDGEATVNLEIIDKAQSPQTGDNINIMLYVMDSTFLIL